MTTDYNYKPLKMEVCISCKEIKDDGIPIDVVNFFTDHPHIVKQCSDCGTILTTKEVRHDYGGEAG